jgi:ech hydrogenase subunit E
LDAVFNSVSAVFRKDYTIKNRFSGVGILSKGDAYRLGTVGPTSRGSGIGQDLRKLGYAAYSRLQNKGRAMMLSPPKQKKKSRRNNY